MRRNYVIVLMVIFFFSVNLCGSENILSEKDKEKIALIAKVKKFAASIGLEPTNNFKEYKESSSKYNLFFYSKKTDVPFSYIDPLLNYENSDYDNLASSVLNYNIDLKEYDVYFYTTLGVASGTYITRNLLNSEDVVIAEVVFHEDMHDNTNLPRHIDEATALIVGVAASSRFVKAEEDDFYCLMDYVAGSAIMLKTLHSNILEMNKSYKEGKMLFDSYITIRDLKLQVTNQESMASVAQNHTYLYFVPTLMRLFEAMNHDLKQFILFMKKFPYREPSWDLGHEAYFKETLRVEKEATEYLEKNIAELEKNRKKDINSCNVPFQKHYFSSVDMIYLVNSLKNKNQIKDFRHLQLPRR